MNILIVVLLRLIIPLTIFRFPLLGGLIAILLDYLDFQLIQILNHGDLTNYQFTDKLLDIYYLTLEVGVVLIWKNKLVRQIGLVLFLYRFIGFLLFSVFQNPLILVLFPNVFEVFYLSYLSSLKIFKKDLLTSTKTLFIVLTIFMSFKIVHEYFLHINNTHPWTENKYIKEIFR